jgi:glycosyltransferase involved in cell wall biosynthesis
LIAQLLLEVGIKRVTVAMAIYNGIDHVAAAVESIVDQTFTDWELLIIDDGSTDGTSEYLAGLADPRIRVLWQPNSGLAAALNRALELCKTEFFARLDGDDVAHPTRLAEQVAYLDSHPEVGLVGTQAVWRFGPAHGRSLALPLNHRPITFALRRGQHAITHSTILCRTDDLLAIRGYWAEGISEDWDMFLRISERTQLANLPSVYQSILLSSSTLTGTNLFEARARIAYACELARRRRRGRPALPFEAFLGSSLRRLRIGADVYSRHQYRLGVTDRLRGRPVRGTARIAWAAACGPRAALYRVARVAIQRLRSTGRRPVTQSAPAVPTEAGS